MRCVCSDELGLLKGVEWAAGQPAPPPPPRVAWRAGSPSRQARVRSLAVSSGADFCVAAAGLHDGGVALYDAATAQKLGELSLFEEADEDEDEVAAVDASAVVGVALHVDAGGSAGAFAAATAGGQVAVQRFSVDGALGEAGAQLACEAEPSVAFAAGKGPVSALCGTNGLARLAAGGERNDLGIFDAETGERVWVAKQPKFTWPLPLPVPYVASAAFLDGHEGGNVVAVGTGSHEVRLYDTRASRRPVWRTDFGECRIACVCAEPPGGPSRIFAATGAGAVGAFDLRQGGAMVGGYKGAQGGVRALARHPSEGWLAAAGLDRWLRVYDANSRKLRAKVYMKQSMTGVGFDMREAPIATPEAEGDAGGDRAPRKKAAASGEVDGGHGGVKKKRRKREE